jgi:uncharacterized protein (DUF2267 family)
MTHHRFLDHAVQGASIWIRDVGSAWGVSDEERCVAALRATLHALRDRLPIDEAAHLAAQLPVLVRGMYFEGWVPSRTPARMHRRDLLERIRHDAGLETVDEAAFAARAVSQVLWKHTTEGAMAHVIGVLPIDLTEVFS